jgi:hypothetical protein
MMGLGLGLELGVMGMGRGKARGIMAIMGVSHGDWDAWELEL